jgi:hypothetical protein
MGIVFDEMLNQKILFFLSIITSLIWGCKTKPILKDSNYTKETLINKKILLLPINSVNHESSYFEDQK